MGRYRPPGAPSTAIITEQGYSALEKELKALWVRRRGVTEAVTAAAAEGDRSENAEYIYRKKELREIDRRVRYLQKRLAVLKVVRDQPDDMSRIYFGASIELLSEAGESSTVRIVGPDETEPSRRWISIDSLMAKALLKKMEGDEVTVEAPGGSCVYEVVSINYRSEQV